MRLFYINAFVTPVFTVAFRPESRSHSYGYASSIHDEIRRVKTGFGFNICYKTPSKTLDAVAMFNLYRHEFFANFVLLKYIPRS